MVDHFHMRVMSDESKMEPVYEGDDYEETYVRSEDYAKLEAKLDVYRALVREAIDKLKPVADA